MRIYDLKRSQVPRMLDDIADEVGPVQADRVLSYIRKGFNWFEVNGHDDDFRSPAVRGMSRTKPDEHARDRILNDDELRTFWQAANPQRNRPNVFAAMLRSILLTVTRRCEGSKMHSSELDGDIWTIPGERYKNKKDHVVPLSTMALGTIEAIPAKPSFIFTTANGKKPFNSFSLAKIELDIADILKREGREPMEPMDHS